MIKTCALRRPILLFDNKHLKLKCSVWISWKLIILIKDMDALPCWCKSSIGQVHTCRKLGPNHTQYKISLTFLHKRRSKESVDHTRPPTLHFHINRLATVRKSKTRTNVEYPGHAAHLKNDETTKRVFPHPSECYIRYTLHKHFHESCLDDFHDTVRKRGFRAKPHSVQNLVDVFVQNDVRKRAPTTLAFVRYIFI